MSLMTQETRRQIVLVAAEIIATVEATPAGMNVHAALESLMQAIDEYWAEECAEVGDTSASLMDELLAEIEHDNRLHLGWVASPSGSGSPNPDRLSYPRPRPHVSYRG